MDRLHDKVYKIARTSTANHWKITVYCLNYWVIWVRRLDMKLDCFRNSPWLFEKCNVNRRFYILMCLVFLTFAHWWASKSCTGTLQLNWLIFDGIHRVLLQLFVHCDKACLALPSIEGVNEKPWISLQMPFVESNVTVSCVLSQWEYVSRKN